jgi:hypothetical protein
VVTHSDRISFYNPTGGGLSWFDPSKARRFDADSERSSERLYLTAGGRWVLEFTSENGDTDDDSNYHVLGPRAARNWLIHHRHDGAVLDYFGEAVPEEYFADPDDGVVYVELHSARMAELRAFAAENDMDESQAAGALLIRGLRERAMPAAPPVRSVPDRRLPGRWGGDDV